MTTTQILIKLAIKLYRVMKKILAIITLFATALSSISCSEDDVPNTILDTNTSLFAISPIAITPPADGGEFELTISGKEEWQIETSEFNTTAKDWITFSKTSGTASDVVKITIQPATSFAKNRSVLISVNSESKTLKSKVLQATMVLGDDEVLVNGLVWSTKNVGMPGEFAASPDDPGMLYQFNRNTPYATTPKETPANWPASYTNDLVNWAEANDPSPEGWRIPTTAEMVALWTIGATWVTPAQTGFAVNGIVVGITPELARTATKENLKQLGGLFLPQCGWRSETGQRDRDWLVAIRSGTSLHKVSGNNADGTKGGMSLGDSGTYRDLWGWGDGAKARAGMLRSVKKLVVTD